MTGRKAVDGNMRFFNVRQLAFASGLSGACTANTRLLRCCLVQGERIAEVPVTSALLVLRDAGITPKGRSNCCCLFQ